MALHNYIIWNGSPEIFSLGSFSLRWYGLFFALGFLITITIYMVVGTILGARLGHIIFYQPDMIWKDPLAIFLPFEFHPFKFTGLQGLASHGAAIGILFVLYLYARKKKPGQNFLQIVDRIVILVALVGALIRLGNYFNSEIVGKPTDKPWGVAFVNRLTSYIEDKQVDEEGIVDMVAYAKNDSIAQTEVGKMPVLVYIFFKPQATEQQIGALVNGPVRNILTSRLYEFFDEQPKLSLDYKIAKENGAYAARIKTIAIVRHPAQLYESISCVFLFILLFAIWNHYKANLPQGRLLGIFLIVCFGLRFAYEFLKENQEAFENSLPINMGQILSIPLILAGIFILMMSYRKSAISNSSIEK